METKNPVCPVCGCEIDARQAQKTCPRCGSVLDQTQSPQVHCCPACQAQNPEHAQFCTHCGFPFQKQPAAQPSMDVPAPVHPAVPNPPIRPAQSPVHMPAVSFTYGGIHPEDTIDGIPAWEIAAFVGSKEKADYYLPRFAKMAQSGRKVSWNWISFLIFPYWALYRRMVKPAVIWLSVAFAAFIAIMTVSFVVALPDMLEIVKQIESNPYGFYEGTPFIYPTSVYIISYAYRIGGLIAMICFGMFGNHFYWRHVKRRLRPAGEPVLERPEERAVRAGSLGGTKISYPLITLGVWIAAEFVVALGFVLAMMHQMMTLVPML